MGPSYQSLPVELLSRVAELVHEQDLAFAASPVPRADPPTSNKPGKHVDVSGGMWRYWHGRGIRALAQVDRRSRTAAVPFLYQNITSKQTSKLYFRVHVLGERLGDSVRHIEVGHYRVQDAAFLACALRKLPNLSSLNLSWQTVAEIVYGRTLPVLSDELDELQSALRSALGKVTSLQFGASGGAALLKVLECVDGARLRKLHWQWPAWPETHDLEIEHALGKLVGLVDFEMSRAYAEELPELQRRLCLPTVRSVVLNNGDVGYEASLALAHYIAPSLVRLTIRHPETNETGLDPAEPLPSPLLPTLESLIIEADEYLPAFHDLELPALEHYKLSLVENFHIFPVDIDRVPFKAAALRTITLAHRGHPDFEASSALVRACSNASVHLIVEQGPVSTRLLGNPIVRIIGDRGERSTIVDTLGWAQRRADWLCEVDDRPGLHELAEATVRLHELRLLDRA